MFQIYLKNVSNYYLKNIHTQRQRRRGILRLEFQECFPIESGLSAVTSDTVCFPAKLVHGHLRNLVKKYHVDRIFMPSITTVPPENTEKTSESMCAVVKGYPIVIRNSDNPQDKWNVPFDHYSTGIRRKTDSVSCLHLCRMNIIFQKKKCLKQ